MLGYSRTRDAAAFFQAGLLVLSSVSFLIASSLASTRLSEYFSLKAALVPAEERLARDDWFLPTTCRESYAIGKRR
jgi:hypothetical protein